MKNKVVVFTQNNARVLINPLSLDKYRGKPNAYINPDLNLVAGVEPHFWKVLHPSKQISQGEALRVRAEIDLWLHLNEDPTYESRYYTALRNSLTKHIESCDKANDLITKLLKVAAGIDPDDVASDLVDSLISNEKSPSIKKENEAFMEYIRKWEMGQVVTMDEYERQAREKNIRINGAQNEGPKSKRKWWKFWRK